MSVTAEDSYKSEGLATKIANFVCCNEYCREVCESCLETISPTEQKVRKLSKSDIQHVINHQPVSRLASAASHASSFSGSALNSPVFYSSRDRMDSENSSGSRTSSRKGSTSSNSEHRRPNPTPIIDMKPIEFWAANREAVQPRTPRRRLPSESEISIEDLKPDLYESIEEPEECLTDEQKINRYKLGQVHFSLQYEVPTKTLIVKMIEARDLPSPYSQDANKQDMARSNPYAKISLLPDQKNSQQTSVQRKTQCPVWDEQFRFELAFKEAQRRTLEIVLKDFDKFSRHCIIGQVHLPLDEMNVIKGIHMWKPLIPSNKENPDLGELLLSLNYLPSAGRLNVDIMKARQLLQTDLIGGSDPYVRVTLYQDDRSVKTRKTSVKKNTIDPVFNESFSFNVVPEQLGQCSLAVTVWDYNSKSKDDFVGRTVIGKYATGPYEVTHWNRMIQCQRSPVAQWHTLRTRKECDEKAPFSGQV